MEKSVDLSNIPQKSGKYQWKNSIGCTCNFTYGDLKGTIKIIDFKLEDINQKNLLRQSYRSFQKQVLAILRPGISLEEISEQTQISVFMLKRMMDLGLFSLEGGN